MIKNRTWIWYFCVKLEKVHGLFNTILKLTRL